LRDLHAAVPGAVRWRHWIAAVDTTGRLRLPARVRPAGDDPAELLVSSYFDLKNPLVG
jgi:hypothetical protein